MATTKKKPSVTKAVKAAPKAAKTAVKKVAAAAKPAPKKAAPKKAAPKAAPKSAPKTAPVSREHKAATSALKLVDEAAGLLRKGITVSADTTEKSRLAAKQRAHSLLSKASSSLGDVLSTGSSALHKAISKL